MLTEDERKIIYEKIDKLDESILISKDPVIGFLVIQVARIPGVRDKELESFICSIPLTQDSEGCGNFYDCEKNEKIIGILPALPETYRVLGLFPDKNHYDDYPSGTYSEIGYEFKGVKQPDWKQVIKDRI